jgi:hypothetical protein
MKVADLARSARVVTFGSSEDPVEVLCSFGTGEKGTFVPVAVFSRGRAAVLTQSDRKFRTVTLHIGKWIGAHGNPPEVKNLTRSELDAAISNLLTMHYGS